MVKKVSPLKRGCEHIFWLITFIFFYCIGNYKIRHHVNRSCKLIFPFSRFLVFSFSSYLSLVTCYFLVSGCASIRYTNIYDIRNNPQEYKGEIVTVRGTVVETLSIPFIRKGMYQIDDGTERIWVMSKNRMPFRGEKVVVEGEVKTGFTIRGRTFGILISEGRE